MSESEMQVSDPEGCLSVSRVKATPGTSPEEQVGAEGDPRRPGMSGEPPIKKPLNDLARTGARLPAQESGSRDIDRMSNDVIVEELYRTFEAVSRFQDPAAMEFLKAKVREVESFSSLLQENEQMKAPKSQEVAQLKADPQEARRSQRTGNLSVSLPRAKKDFHIQVRVDGKTGGCEAQFIKKVSEHLSSINLKAEKYREGSGHFLLVFRPVSSSVVIDMANALEGLSSEPKAVLVMLHHISKEWDHFVDTKPQAQHPAMVCTIHARYTIQEGFYTSPMNEEAVAAVAKVLEHRCKGEKGDPTIPGSPSKSWNP